MDDLTVFPDTKITGAGVFSNKFLGLGVGTYADACRFVHELPYGYNSTKDDRMILFKENRGTCTTKHAVIATLGEELALPVSKTVCVYAMTEGIVTGTAAILESKNLPYIPMIHCFLEYEGFKIDLTEGNHNGKNRSIEECLYTETVEPFISEKDEYLLYRKSLERHVLTRPEMKGVVIKTILRAREEGLALLKSNVSR